MPWSGLVAGEWGDQRGCTRRRREKRSDVDPGFACSTQARLGLRAQAARGKRTRQQASHRVLHPWRHILVGQVTFGIATEGQT